MNPTKIIFGTVLASLLALCSFCLQAEEVETTTSSDESATKHDKVQMKLKLTTQHLKFSTDSLVLLQNSQVRLLGSLLKPLIQS